MHGRRGRGVSGRAASFAAALALALTATSIAACGSDEGAADTPDSSLAEASAEAATEDTFVPPREDAGEDAPADGPNDGPVEAGAPFCSTLVPAPRFCDDFDDGDVDDDWDVRNVLGGSTLTLGTTTFASGTAAMHVVTKALGPATSAPAHLRHTLVGAASHPKLSFSVYFATTPVLTQGALALATLDVSASHFFTLYMLDSPDDPGTPAAVLEEINGATKTRFPLAKLPAMGAWSRIVMDIDLAGGTATVTVGADKAVDAVAIAAVAGTEATFRVGAVYLFGPAIANDISFDDVVVDF